MTTEPKAIEMQERKKTTLVGDGYMELFCRAESLEQKGELESALKLYQELLTHKPAYLPLRNCGIILTKLKRYEEALPYFSKALKSTKYDILLYRYQTEALHNLQRYSEELDSLYKLKGLYALFINDENKKQYAEVDSRIQELEQQNNKPKT